MDNNFVIFEGKSEIGSKLVWTGSKKFNIGDVVKIQKPGRFNSDIGIIVERSLETKYVEARPIKMVEFESYRVQSSKFEKLTSFEGDFLSLAI